MALRLFVLVLFVRLIFGALGLDRLPLTSTYDEVSINEAALSYATTGRLQAKNYGDGLLSEVYALYPPFYPLSQSYFLRTFGLNSYTVRWLPALLATLSFIFLFLMLGLLQRQGRVTAITSSLLLVWAVFDPGLLAVSRGGRPEGFGLFFALGGMYALLKVALEKWDRRVFLLGLSAIGLAMASHWSYLYYYVVATILFGIFRPAVSRKMDLALLVTVPVVVFAAVWVFAHGSHAFEAFQTFQSARKLQTSGEFWFGIYSNRASLLLAGLTIHACLLFGALILLQLPALSSVNTQEKRYLLASGASVLATILLAWFILSFFNLRAVVIFPWLLVSFAMVSNRLSVSRPLAVSGASLALLLSLAYEGMLVKEWRLRDPGRQEAQVIDLLSTKSRPTVITEPLLWLPIRKLGIVPRVVCTGEEFDKQNIASKDRAYFQRFDFALLEEGTIARFPSMVAAFPTSAARKVDFHGRQYLFFENGAAAPTLLGKN